MSEQLEPPVSQDFHDALAFASVLHRAQARKSTTIPYVAHLLAVSSIVMEAGGTEAEAIAALLHDGPEDQGGLQTLDAIRARFGDAVANIVASCSDTFETPKPEWPIRKRNYIEHLKSASKSALLVSASDKLHNARATLRDLREHGPAVWDRFTGTREQILENYAGLIGAYDHGAADVRRSAIVSELRDTVAQL